MSVTQMIHQKDGIAEIRFPYDPIFIDQLKTHVPAWCREWVPTDKVWIVKPPYVEQVLDAMRNRFGHVEVYGEPVSFTQGSRHECRCDDAHRTLMVCQDAPPEVVKAAYRALSKSSHPDSGGDHIQMIQLTEAYERVLGGVR